MKWTEEDIQLLRDSAHLYTVEELSDMLDRSITAITKKLKEYGLRAAQKSEGVLRALADTQTRYRLAGRPVRQGIANPQRKILSISDLHFPFCRVDLLNTVVDQHSDADIVVVNGDILDGYAFSTFPKNLEVKAIDEYRMAFNFISDLSKRFPKVVLVSGNHDCFDADTLCLTKELGWVKHEDLTNDLHVLTLNHSGESEWQKIQIIHRYDYDGEMYELGGANSKLGIKSMTTPNHRVMHYVRNQIQYTEAKDLNRQRVYFPVSGQNNLPDLAGISDDEIRLAGWILTDGWIKETYAFSQRESKHKQITDLLDSLGYEYSVSIRDRNITQICGKILKKPPEPECLIRVKAISRNTIDRYMKRSKDIPEWIEELSTRQFDLLLETLIAGDGSISHQKSKMLYVQGLSRVSKLQAALVRNGYRASLYAYPNDNWRINITKRSFNAVDSFKQNYRTVNYVGKVWCVSVPNTNFMVMRSGKAYFSGNSRPSKAMSEIPWRKSAREIFRQDLIQRIADGEELDESGRVIRVHRFDNVIYQQPDSWWVQIGKTIFAHPSGYKKGPAGTVTALDALFSEKLGTDAYDSMVIGHTHKLHKAILNNRLLIEQGSFSARQDYEHKSNMIFRHAMNGYAVIYQDAQGNTDFNASNIYYLGSEIPPKKPVL